MTDWSSAEFVLKMNQRYRDKTHDPSAKRISTVTERQRASTKPVAATGPMWASKFAVQAPHEMEIQRLLFQVIDLLDEGNEPYKRAELGPLEGHWVGFRSGVGKDERESTLPEAEKYSLMKKDTKKDLVVFYVHGGSFHMNDPTQLRPVYMRLAKETGGRVYVVRQRLCPQHPFPSALLDILVGYLSLIAPPPGSFHEPVQPSKIVISGDSSGGCLALSLLQVLLVIKRHRLADTVLFYGNAINIQQWLPAGIAPISPVADLANGLPSHFRNTHDIFPERYPPCQPEWPVCDLWPTNPPRANLYCDVPRLLHPIVSPCLAKDWTGSPPMWFGMGQENSEDSIKLIAQTAAKQGVNVVFTEYELMPHFFGVVYAASPQSQKLWAQWTSTIRNMASGSSIGSRAVFVALEDLSEKSLDVENLVSLTREQARRYIFDSTMIMHPFTGRVPVRGAKI